MNEGGPDSAGWMPASLNKQETHNTCRFGNSDNIREGTGNRQRNGVEGGSRLHVADHIDAQIERIESDLTTAFACRMERTHYIHLALSQIAVVTRRLLWTRAKL